MLEITSEFRDGVFVPDSPVELPRGTKARIQIPDPNTTRSDHEADLPFQMLREEDWPTTPEGIAALLERWKEHQPPIYVPGEEAELKAWRAEMKRFNIEAVRKQMGLPE